MVLEGTVAVVGKDPILLSELNEITKITLMREGKPPEDTALFKEMRHIVLQRIVDDRVLLEHAQQESIIVTNEEVEERLKAQMDALQEQAGSREALEEQLKSQVGLTYLELKKKYQKDIREQLIKVKFREKLFQKTSATNEEVVAFFNNNQDSLPMDSASVNLSHIMIKVAPEKSMEERALKKIEGAQARIAAGERFEKIAFELSEDPSAKDSGDIGFISRGAIGLPEFESAAFSLDAGAVSSIAKSKLGYHLIKVVEKNDRQVHIRHILVLLKPSDDIVNTALARLDSLKSSIKDSAGFAVAAAKYSEDAKTKANGGYLGWFPSGRLSPEYREAIEKLKPGEISKAIMVDNACHIFLVNQATQSRKLTLADDYAMIQKMAGYDKIKQQLEGNLRLWRSNVYIEDNLDKIDP